MTMRSFLQALMIFLGDVNAVQKGRVGRRVARRAYGKASGGLARKMFR